MRYPLSISSRIRLKKYALKYQSITTNNNLMPEMPLRMDKVVLFIMMASNYKT